MAETNLTEQTSHTARLKSNLCKRISGRAVFKCVEEAVSMGACKQGEEKKESQLDHYNECQATPLECGNLWLLRFLEPLLTADFNVSPR